MKFISVIIVMLLTVTTYADRGSVNRIRRINSNQYNNQNIVIQQKIFDYDNFSKLSVIAVPVSDLGLQYYYQTEPLRGRNLSQEDRDAIVKDIVAGVLAGIDERFDIEGAGGNVGGGEKPEDVPPPQDNTNPTDAKVLAMMEKYNCGLCHTEGQLEKDGVPVLLTKDGKLNTLDDPKLEKLRRFEIHDSVYFGRMPKNGSLVSENDVKVFHEWIQHVK